MSGNARALAAALALTAAASPLSAQATAPAAPPDFMAATMEMGAKHIRAMFSIAADSMTEADYAFKPTPEVRSFGQLLAHVAASNYHFCASALGEQPPATDLEKSKTTRADIRQALGESMDYCDRAFASMHDATKAITPRPFRQSQLPALALLNFRNYHALLHWGNAITYMRLRGKVPPSA
jgi:uncharacterized damage-inducible protein DinB